MNKLVKNATGPISEEGKKKSSQNARTNCIFVKGLLDDEDPQELQAFMQGLRKEWGAEPSAQIHLMFIEQAVIEVQRIQLAVKERIEGKMQSIDIAHQFASETGLSVMSNFPHWFFSTDDGRQKEVALEVDRVKDEADYLYAHYRDRLAPNLATEFSHLYKYVMRGQPSNQSFLVSLGLRYKQSTPTLNFGAVSNEIAKKYPDHLVWASDPQVFEITIRGIRAQQRLEVMELEKMGRYLTRAQNAITKAMTSLMGQKQYRLMMARQERELLLEQNTIELIDTSQLSANASVFVASTQVVNSNCAVDRTGTDSK